MKTRTKLMCVAGIVVMLVMCGCAVTQPGEPIVKPETVETIDAIASIVDPLSQTTASLGLLWPPAAAIGGLLAGMVGVWRKMKPELQTAKSEADLGALAGEATATALEAFKKAHPDEWGTLSDYLESNHGPTVENFYRALRGLPPKG